MKNTAEPTLSYEAEEYIEEIYRLQKRDGLAKTKNLSEALKVVPGSITNTIMHLESHGLVDHKPYKGGKLTKEGEKLAIDIIRRHRLAERLLTDILKAEWSTVHEDACKLEHALTKNVINLLEKSLGNPKSCPHGNPIPSEKGDFHEEKCQNLSEIKPGVSCTVNRISEESRQNLEIFGKWGIKPDNHVYIKNKSSEDMTLIIDKQEFKLPLSAANKVCVKT